MLATTYDVAIDLFPQTDALYKVSIIVAIY
jgi:hypothetical protein